MPGKVLAVSVAKPRWHEIFGRPVLSSIVREAHPGPVAFRLGGPIGNETAVHTEEVFAFFAEHYAFWTAELGIDQKEWGDCFWGENIMLSGMPAEDALCIGDRYRIGKALLEVTSPRIPCFKLAWRLGQPESFLKTLIESGRMGCYLRVIEPGDIEAGDTARLEARVDGAISVLELSRLLHAPELEDLEHMRRVLATPALGGQAAGMIRKRLAFLTDGRIPARGRWSGWRRFRIAEIACKARDVQSFHLIPVDDQPIGGYRAGQFIAVRLPETAGGHVRSWSLCDYDQDGVGYRIAIKREPGGAASNWMHDVARIGDIVEVRPPSGRFLLDRSGFLRVVLISAGIGVTPMLAMLKAHAERGVEAPPLLWIHVARSGERHAFAAEVNEGLAKIPNATRRVYYSAPNVADALGVSHDHVGRFDASGVAEIVAETYELSPFGRTFELTGDNSEVYICGPRSFEQSIRAALLDHGVDSGAIYSESFHPPNSTSGNMPAAPDRAEVEVIGTKRILTWLKDSDSTLLELLERSGISVDHSCRSGICGTCEAILREGSVGYSIQPATNPPSGRILLCCSQPTSARLSIETRLPDP